MHPRRVDDRLTLDRLAVESGATTNRDRASLATDAWLATVDAVCAEAALVLAEIDAAVAGPYREVVVAGGWLRNAALRAAKLRRFPAMRITDVAEPGAYGSGADGPCRRRGGPDRRRTT